MPLGGGREELTGDIHAFNRQLKLMDKFGYVHNTYSHTSPLGEPPLSTITKPIQTLIKQNYRSAIQYSQSTNKNNLQPTHRRALKQLQKNTDIIITLADKGSGIIVLDKQQYLLKNLSSAT